jgi:hypothetical protein
MKILKSVLLMIIMSGRLCAESVRLSPVADTTLFESSPGDNMGGWTHVAAGTTGRLADATRNRGLFRFDLEAIPRGAKVTNVVLVLTVTGVPATVGGGGRADSDFHLHRVLQSWGEGDKLGDRGFPADPGEATWNSSFHPDVAWNLPGGSASTDFVAAPSASRFIAGLNRYPFGPDPRLVADVQHWVAHPETNFGWMLIAEEEERLKTARRFASREDEGSAPTLLIEYEMPAQFQIREAAVREKTFAFSIPVEQGKQYQVDYTFYPRSGVWNVLTNFTGAETEMVVIEDLNTAPQKFYRAVELMD